jgi:Holliday junction resolvasome RuvABC endonuclease subunit
MVQGAPPQHSRGPHVAVLIQRMVQCLTGIRAVNDNENDAIAVGLTHLRSAQCQKAIEAAINA